MEFLCKVLVLFWFLYYVGKCVVLFVIFWFDWRVRWVLFLMVLFVFVFEILGWYYLSGSGDFYFLCGFWSDCDGEIEGWFLLLFGLLEMEECGFNVGEFVRFDGKLGIYMEGWSIVLLLEWCDDKWKYIDKFLSNSWCFWFCVCKLGMC